VALPELFATGYRLDERYIDFAELIPGGPTTRAVERVAADNGVHVVGCIVERSAHTGLLYDSAFLVGPEGYLGKTRKSQLWQREQLYFCRGSLSREVFRTPVGNIGVTICYEAGFPEIPRYCVANGAQLLVEVSALGRPRYAIWETLIRSRAMENGVFVVAADRVGAEGETEFCGLSRVISPSGVILAKAPDSQSEAVVIADINLEEIAEQRQKVPFLRDYLSCPLRLTSPAWLPVVGAQGKGNDDG